jgi:hypothetical protein
MDAALSDYQQVLFISCDSQFGGQLCGLSAIDRTKLGKISQAALVALVQSCYYFYITFRDDHAVLYTFSQSRLTQLLRHCRMLHHPVPVVDSLNATSRIWLTLLVL